MTSDPATDRLYPHVSWTKDPGMDGKVGTGWWLWLAEGEPTAGPFETHDAAVDAAELYR